MFCFYDIFVANIGFCTTDGSVEKELVENVCQQVTEISMLYPEWEKPVECLSNGTWLVDTMLPFCQKFKIISQMNVIQQSLSIHYLFEEYSLTNQLKTFLLSMEDVFAELVPLWQYIAQSTYDGYRNSLYSHISPELPTIYRVNTATDITISNENFLPIHENLFQVEFNVTGNKLIHITIRNSIFKNLHLHLDSSRSSVNIEENIFIGSGIKIVEENEDTAKVTLIKNNRFQGNYKRPVMELINMKNVSLKKNYFENLYSHLRGEVLSIGIFCNSSELDLSDFSFKNVKLDNFIHLDSCSVQMNNMRVLGNPLINNNENTAIKMKKSNGTFSNMMFLDIHGSRFFSIHVLKGELLIQNITFHGNYLHSFSLYHAMIYIAYSRISIINITAVKNSGAFMYIIDSWANLSSGSWLLNSGDQNFITLLDSHMEIDDTFFENNNFDTFLEFKYSAQGKISKCSFTQNRGTLILCSYQEVELEILSCTFEENMQNENSLINIDTGFIKFQDTFFLNNLVNETETVMISLRSVRAFLDNCTATNKYGGYSFRFMKILASSVNISNCQMSSYCFGDLERSTISIENTLFEKGGSIRASFHSTAVIKNSTFIENRSFGSYGGSIFLTDNSNLVSENCTFSGNTATMDGGAVMVTDSSTYRDTGSLFFNNTAPNYGKLI